MYCNECGATNPDSAKFCNACGAKLTHPSSIVKENEYMEETEDNKYKEDSIKSPSLLVPEKADEDGYSDDMDDETDTPEELPSVDDAMAALSNFNNRISSSSSSLNSIPTTNKEPYPIIDDHYFNDVLPEIENEIFSIPKDNILKIIISILGLGVIMVWLIYWLS